MNTARRKLGVPLLTLTLAVAGTGCAAPEREVTADQVVTALEGTFGVHPGERRNHIRGTCALGTFVGTVEARAYTRSALFSGDSVPVVARFSLAGGNPNAPDTARIPRGMALEFRLPGGALQHMTMLNTPVFGAASPRTFLDDITAKRPDPATGRPAPESLAAFRERHPDSRPQAEFLAGHNPPVSWATAAYFGIHTFRFVNGDSVTTLVRWRFVPRDGEQELTAEAMRSAPARFLEQALIERVARGPVLWDMVLTIGAAGDPENDPTLPWPGDRREVTVGTLTLSTAMPQGGAACERINYDPLVMADGIAPTDDPVLRFRSAAYAVSFGKRLSGL